jgi:hypothetical protein
VDFVRSKQSLYAPVADDILPNALHKAPSLGLTITTIDNSSLTSHTAPTTIAMAAFDHSLIARSDELLHEFMKRKNKNWAYKNPGVVLVFCIIGTIAILLIGLTVMKRVQARRAKA